jgi:hypothetical protein
MSVSVDLFLFLYFQDDLEYHYVLVLQEAFVGYDQTIANGVGLTSLELVLPKFVPNIIISDSIFSCVATYPMQHPYFSYTHLLDVLSFYSPTFCVIHHRGFNRRPIDFVFYFVWDIVTENTRCLSPFHPSSSYYMTNIFIDLSVTLQY